MMMCLIIAIVNFLLKYVITWKYTTALVGEMLIWCFVIIRYSVRRIWAVLLYGYTHDSDEDKYYQKCIAGMYDNECRHVREETA